MSPRSVKLTALANIILVLSMHPITAYRVMEAERTVTSLQSTQELVHELQRALQEDMQGHQLAVDANSTQGYIGETFASCEQRKEDFERRALKAKARYDKAMEDKKMSLTESVWVILKVRSLAKTMQTAQTQGCDLSDVDKSAMDALIAETAPKTKCFDATKKTLDDAVGADEERQKAAFVEAMGIFLADDCKPVKGKQPSEGEVLTEFEITEQKVDVEIKELQAAVGKNVKGKLGNALLEAEGFDVAELEALSSPHRADSVLAFTDALLQVGEGGANPLMEVVGQAIGWIFLAICWVLFCYVLAAIALLVFGLIMCILKIIIVAFIRLFGSKKWDFKFGKCMKFWLGALGHGSSHHSGGDIGIALCAANMMTGRR